MFAKIRLVLLVCLILVIAAPIYAQEDSDGEKNLPFSMVTDDPVVNRELNTILDNRYSNPGAMIYHDGQFHMFRNGFRGWPSRVTVTYLVSDDGITWEMGSEETVLTHSAVDYAEVLIMVSSVHVEDDGTWVMYFYTWDNYTAPIGIGRIGRATAESPGGPWIADETPALDIGPEGAWDAQQVGVPLVVKADDLYWMYYSGFSVDGEMRIGLAISEDGITWEKYNGESNDDDVFYAESDPVLTPSEDGWDNRGVERPRVVITDDGWFMVYRANVASAGLGLATSQDGLNWTKVGDAPILEIDQIPHGTGTFLFTFLHQDDTYYLFTEATLDNQSTSEIFLLTAEGSLLPDME